MNGLSSPISWGKALAGEDGLNGVVRKSLLKKWHRFNRWCASTPMPIQEPRTSKYPDGVTAWAARLCSTRPMVAAASLSGYRLHYFSGMQVGQVISDELPAAPYKKSRLNQSAFSSDHKEKRHFRYYLIIAVSYSSLHRVVNQTTQSC